MTTSGKEITSSCIGSAVTFTNTSTVSGDNLTWTYNNITTNGNTATYSFTTANTYTITLRNKITNAEFSKTLTVYSNPTVALDISKSSVCTGGEISFSGTTNSPNSIKNYYWQFGDGSSVTQTNTTTHSFNQSGNYSTYLYVEDVNGCRSNPTSVKNITVIGALNVGFTANGTDYYSCDNAINFQNTTNENGISGIIYTWDFGDGTNSTEKSPGQHNYANAGKYIVKLTANVPGNVECSPGYSKAVYVGKPDIQINLNSNTTCVNAAIPITAKIFPSSFLASNQDIKWSANGTFNSDSTNLSFASERTYSIMATNANGCKTSATTNILVNPAPNATITLTPNYGICIQTSISMGTDINTEVLSYNWNTGDGTTGSNPTLQHTYTKAGSYNASLKLTNAYNCSQNINQTITVSEKCIDNGLGSTYNPTFGFYSPNCDNKFIVKFYTKDKKIPISDWIIDNKDYPNTGDTTQITLSKKGVGETYSVLVKFENGNYDIAREITIIDEKVDFDIQNYDNSNNLFCANNNFIFNAAKYVNTSNLLKSYLWTIQDSNQKIINSTNTDNPLFQPYIFDSTGNYSIKLQVQDITRQSCILERTKSIVVYGTLVDFDANKKVICNRYDDYVTFTNKSRNNSSKILSYTWDLGDGESRITTANEKQITKYYKSTHKDWTYAVKLYAKDEYGCQSYVARTNYIKVYNPLVAFSTSDTILCSSRKIIIQNNSDAITPAKYNWTVGSYTKEYQNRSDLNINVSIDQFPKFFDVNLKVTDAAGCTADTTIKNYIKFAKPKADISIVNSELLQTCPPYTLQLNNKSTYTDSIGIWTFSDGTRNQGNENVYFPITHPGTYDIKLFANGYDGCSDSVHQEIIVKGPVAKLTSSDSIGCLPLKTNFNIISQDSIVNYQWDLNDGTSFSSTSIRDYAHSYMQRGNYWPTVLIIGTQEDGGCTDVISLEDSIIANTQNPIIDVVNRTVFCSYDTAVFLNIKDISGFPVQQYIWHWNDGSADEVSDADSIKHIFPANELKYPIYLSAITDYCTVNSDTLNVSYHIQPKAVLSGNNNICTNDSMSFVVNVNNGENANNLYYWYINDSLVQSGTDSIYMNSHLNNAIHKISTIVKTESGCQDSVFENINMKAIPIITFATIPPFCTGDSIQLTVSAPDALSYSWLPNKNIMNDSTNQPIIFPDSTSTYYVNVIGSNNCNNTDSLLVVVDQKMGLSFKDSYKYCLSDTAGITLNANAINTETFLWSQTPTTGFLSSDTGKSILVKPLETTIYKVAAISNNSCPDEYGDILVNAYKTPVISFPNKIISIPAGEIFNLNPTIKNDNALYNYEWTPKTRLDNPYSKNPQVISDNDIVYSLKISSEFGCSANDSITIKVLCNSSKLLMANAFTPNGDGKNDRFYVSGYGIKNVENFIIVDRWGKKVFERNNIAANDFNQGWDGTINGKLAEPGTYMYIANVVCTEGAKFPLKGSVVLIR